MSSDGVSCLSWLRRASDFGALPVGRHGVRMILEPGLNGWTSARYVTKTYRASSARTANRGDPDCSITRRSAVGSDVDHVPKRVTLDDRPGVSFEYTGPVQNIVNARTERDRRNSDPVAS